MVQGARKNQTTLNSKWCSIYTWKHHKHDQTIRLWSLINKNSYWWL